MRYLTVNRVVRTLFISADVERCAGWIAHVNEFLTLNAAVVSTAGDVFLHLSAEPVDAIVVGEAIRDGSVHDLLDDLVARHPAIPVIAIVPTGAGWADALEHGAVEVVADNDLSYLGTAIVRAIRDAGLSNALRSAHDELHDLLVTSERQTRMLANAPALIWSTDDALVLRAIDGADANPAALGQPLARWDAYADAHDRSRVVEAHRRALGGLTTSVRARWLGRMRYMTIAPIRGGGRVTGTAGAALVISTEEAEEAALAAGLDPVTDLPNRAIFEQRVEVALRAAAETGARVAVFFIDIDRFKTVNDLGGHAAGDAVLRAIGDRLHQAIGPRGALARFSADEFVVMCSGLDDPARADSLVGGLRELFVPPFVYGEHEFHLTASIGTCFAPDDAETAHALIAQAEAALFDAKRMGRNVARRYVPTMQGTPSERHALQRELLRAIDRRQLELMYQPVYDVPSGNIVSVEALLRWHHPTLGLVVPDRFIPMAEESGLIEAIGEWVIVRVCEQVRLWSDAGIAGVRVSLNVSARQLDRLALHHIIGDAIANSGIAPETLEIEVTETSILRDVYSATLLLRRLRDMGLRVAIDDFGAGFTSLAFLRDLPIDDLKIDRSFVRDLATGAFDGAVVRAMVTLARSLGLRTVAEGVEEAAQMDILREIRCDAVQGFLFSAPLTAAACEPLLRG